MNIIDRLVKKERRIYVNSPNLARYTFAIYEVCGHRADTVTVEPYYWNVGDQEWVLTFKATGAQMDAIRAMLAQG